MHKNIKYGTFQAIFELLLFIKKKKEYKKEAEELLKVVGLYEKEMSLPAIFLMGNKRKLEIARALATNPKILFLDEPAAGMNPQETADLTKLIHKIKEEFHVTIVLIEHDMSLVMSI